MLTSLYKGAVLPEGVPQDRIDHLFSVGAIEETDVPAPTMAEVEPNLNVRGAGEGPGGGDQPPAVTVTPYDDPERVAARAKLPDDGSLPHHASGQPVWVEYLVGRGYDYAAIQGQDKTVLVDLAKSVDQGR